MEANNETVFDSIVVVLNYSVEVRDGGLGVEPNLGSFFFTVSRTCRNVKIAAFVGGTDYARALEWVTDPRVRLECLGRPKVNSNLVSRAFTYLLATVRILRTVWGNRRFYIFAPGNVSWIFLIACTMFRRRYAVYLRGDWELATPFPFRYMKKMPLKRADFILVAAESAYQEVRHYNPRCAKVVPMTSFFEPRGGTRDFKFKNKIRLLFVGQMIRAKGVFELVEAFQPIAARYRHAELVFVGEGSDKSALQNFVQDLGIQRQVVLAGFVADASKLRNIYEESDIFVLPTYFPEGFPRVLYEAMMHSLPVITTDAGGIGSVMADSVDCLLVKKRDAGDIARAVFALLENEELRARIGNNGRKLFDRLFEERNSIYESHGAQFVSWAKSGGWY